jgi:hypothetical protein
MTNQTVAATTAYLQACPESVYSSIPQYFVDQANEGYSKHQITGDLFLARKFSIELFNPSLRVDPILGEEYVTAKLKLRAILDSEFNLVPMRKGNSKLNPGESWLKGHYSPELRFDIKMVEAGYITGDELYALIKYEELWKSMGTEAYDTAKDADGKSNSKKRLWLTAKDPSAVFQFFYVDRTNPTNGEQTAGLTNIGWANMQIIGSTTGGVVETIASAVEIMQQGGGVNRTRTVSTVVDTAPALIVESTARKRPGQ